jgi:hypothetical protein
MHERIFLTYTNATAVPYQGSVLGHHIVLNYVDSDGRHYTLQGMPEHGFDHNMAKLAAFLREEVWSDGANNRDSAFQRLRAKRGEDFGPALSRPSTLIAEGDDLRSQWARMADFGDEVNSTGYEYRPYSQNSNSFAAGALKRAGFFGPGTAFPEIFDRLIAVDPVSGETRAIRVPGFDKRLTNPLNETARHSSAPTIPVAPVNVFPAEVSRQFGSWISSPAGSAQPKPDLPAWVPDVGGGPDVLDRQPQRFLVKRVVGRPEAANFDRGAAAVPFVPANEDISHSQNPFADRFGNWTSSPAGITPRNPHLPLPPAEPDRPLGIFSGQPMPLWTTPLPLDRISNNRSGASNSGRGRTATPGFGSENIAPPPQTDGNNPIRYLSRRIVNQPQTPAFDTSLPVVPSVPLDDRNFSGGLAGRIAALAGIDPDNPDQPAPPPGGLLALLLAAQR